MRQKHEIIIALVSILAVFYTTYHYNVIVKEDLIIVQNPDHDVETARFSCDDIQKSRIKLLQKQCQKLLTVSEKEKLGPIKSQFFDDPPNPKMNNVYVNHPRKLRFQSFTFLMADLHQDINRISSFSRCLNGTFP